MRCADKDARSLLLSIAGGARNPKLSLGGFVIVDDHSHKPRAQAVHDFRRAHGIKDEIIDIDGMGSYWRRKI